MLFLKNKPTPIDTIILQKQNAIYSEKSRFNYFLLKANPIAASLTPNLSEISIAKYEF